MSTSPRQISFSRGMGIMGGLFGALAGMIGFLALWSTVTGTGEPDTPGPVPDELVPIVRDVEQLEAAAYKLQSAKGIRRPRQYSFATLSREGGYGGASFMDSEDVSPYVRRRTVFLLRYKRKAIGTYEISGDTAYQYYVDIAAVAWPERQALGCARVMGASSASFQTYSPGAKPSEPDYGVLLDKQLQEWVDALPL